MTLYGVSSETQVAYVHIHNSDDDGIQFFGGDIDVASVWVTCAGDDSVDWDLGFRGALSNVNSSPAVDTPFDLEEGSGGTFSNVVIGSAYTGACFSSGAVDAVSASDFTSFEYACTNNLSLLPTSSTAPTGYPNNTFWTAYPGTCN